ncbi:hypothetical protein M569_08919, partial [Genlisea aurea]
SSILCGAIVFTDCSHLEQSFFYFKIGLRRSTAISRKLWSFLLPQKINTATIVCFLRTIKCAFVLRCVSYS